MAEFELKVTIKDILLNLIDENEGQIPGVPRNPRRITEEAFELLKKSITESPEMQNLDEVKVFPINGRYVAVGGNHRIRAYKALGWKKVRCKVLPEDTPAKKLMEYVMKDNLNYATNDPVKLEEWNQEQLADWGVDVPNFNSIDIDSFFEELDQSVTQERSFKITISCPSSLAENKDEIIDMIKTVLMDYNVKIS